MKTEVAKSLNVIERKKLKSLEEVVERGVESFLATGSALKEIRDERLYREDHKTFESYVKSKWGFDRTHAYRLIESSDIKKDLSPVGDKIPKASEINTERQLRELRTVPSEAIEAVVEKAAEIAGDAPITAKVLKEAREQVLAEPEELVYEDVPDEPKIPDALKCVPWFKDQLKLVNELKRNLDTVKELPGTELIFGRQRSILREIEHVKGGFVAAMPHSVCPRCKGEACAQCGNIGWVNKQRFDELQGV